MKVLRVIGSMDPKSGGPCQGIRNSIPEMRKRGIVNEVVCFDSPESSFLSDDDLAIHALGPGFGPWNYCSKFIPWLLNSIFKYDVIIIHGIWLYHSFAVNRAYKMISKNLEFDSARLPKVFVMPHGMLDPYFQRASNRKLKSIRNWFYWKIFESKVINEAEGVLFTCEAELELARLSFKPYKPKRELNVGYGIKTPPFFSSKYIDAFHQKCPEIVGSPFLLFLSRIHEKKGVILLLKAYEQILEALDGESTPSFSKNHIPKLVIAGPGLDSTYGSRVRTIVNESILLQSNVFFPGMLEGDAKWGSFYSCDAFVLPSHQENFGIAVVEALSCGKPVLISNQVNIWHEINTLGAGLICDDNIDGIKSMIRDWLHLSSSNKIRMSNNAKLTFNTFYKVGPAAESLIRSISK